MRRGMVLVCVLASGGVGWYVGRSGVESWRERDLVRAAAEPSAIDAPTHHPSPVDVALAAAPVARDRVRAATEPSAIDAPTRDQGSDDVALAPAPVARDPEPEPRRERVPVPEPADPVPLLDGTVRITLDAKAWQAVKDAAEYPKPGERRIVRAEGPAIDGVPHGVWTLHYDHGARSEGAFVLGARHGLWRSFDSSGHLYMAGEYKAGTAVGSWQYRLQDGQFTYGDPPASQ